MTARPFADENLPAGVEVVVVDVDGAVVQVATPDVAHGKKSDS